MENGNNYREQIRTVVSNAAGHEMPAINRFNYTLIQLMLHAIALEDLHLIYCTHFVNLPNINLHA